MRYAILLFAISLTIFACNQPEPGVIDNETLARKLFAAVKEDDFEQSEQLFPDKGTYRKIMKEWKQVDISEETYDSLATAAEMNFNTVKNFLSNWSDTKFVNIHSETSKDGSLQFSNTTTKFEDKGDFYKFSCTTCKYNGNWFYMGDISWVPK